MKRVIPGLMILMVFIAGGMVAYRASTSSEVQAQPATVNETAADARTLITTKGQIVPLRHAALSFQMGGRVAEILGHEGEVVQAGDLLARLDDTNQQIAVSHAEARLAQAQANLQTAESLLAAAQANLETTQIGVMTAQTQLAILTAEPSAQQIAAIESQVNVAQANIALAAANRDIMVQPATQAQVYAAESQLIAAEAARQPVQVAYDQLPEGATAETVELLEMQLNAAQAQVNAAQAALNELQEGTSASQQQAANAIVSVAVAQRDAAQARLDLLLAGPKPEQVQLAEIGVSRAEATVSQAELAVVQAEKAVAEAQTGVERAQIVLQAAQTALDQMTLRAPFDGTITHLAIEPGEVVGSGASVITLADLSGWQVETTDLTELDVVLLQVGLPVTVRVEALPGAEMNGRVVGISAVSQLVQGDVTYVVTVRLDETVLPVRWGMTASVEMDVNEP